MTSALSRCTLAAILALTMLMGGCQKSKITDENFAKITKGMNLSQVETIFGESGKDETAPAGFDISGGGIGSQTASPEKIYTWKSKDLKIIVTLKDGKVVQLEKRAI